jgi:hypothetical protein
MHFLRKTEREPVFRLPKPWAAVSVRVDKNDLVVQSGVSVAEGGIALALLSARFRVVSGDGETVGPTPGSKFFVSLESFDPLHLLLEWRGG